MFLDEERVLYLAVDSASGEPTLGPDPFNWELTQRSNKHWKISVPASFSASQLTTELPVEIGCPIILGADGAEWEFEDAC